RAHLSCETPHRLGVERRAHTEDHRRDADPFVLVQALQRIFDAPDRQRSHHGAADTLAHIGAPSFDLALAVSQAQPRIATGGDLDLVWIAIDLLTVRAEDLHLVCDLRRGTETVPHVRVFRRRAQRLSLATTADQDRQAPLDRLRVPERPGERVALPSIRRSVVREEETDDPARLVELGQADAGCVEVDAVHPVLGLVPGRADAEDGPAG